MSLFTVTTKLWPSGDSLDTGTDNNVVSVPPGSASFDRHAANFVTSPDGTQNFEFLFWNTGRHITNKRHVHWEFSVGGWGVWTATKWYGTPGKSNGSHVVRVDPFSIGDNGPITGSGTAIANPPASTFPAGATPYMGDDHLINTANGAVDVAAKDPFAGLQFAGWDQLIWGGDDSGEFDESDSGASQGSPGFFPVGSGTFHVAQNGGANLLALYGNSGSPKIWIENLKPQIDVLKSLSSEIPKFKDSEGYPWQQYGVDPAWLQTVRLIAERSDLLQKEVSELRAFILKEERPQVGEQALKEEQKPAPGKDRKKR